MQKKYEAPAVSSEAIQVGVFGQYGSNSCGPIAFSLWRRPKRKRWHWR